MKKQAKLDPLEAAFLWRSDDLVCFHCTCVELPMKGWWWWDWFDSQRHGWTASWLVLALVVVSVALNYVVEVEHVKERAQLHSHLTCPSCALPPSSSSMATKI